MNYGEGSLVQVCNCTDSTAHFFKVGQVVRLLKQQGEGLWLAESLNKQLRQLVLVRDFDPDYVLNPCRCKQHKEESGGR